MSSDRERRLVQAFFAPETCPRYAASLSTPKGRRRFISGPAHLKALDARFARRLPPGEQDIDATHKELQRRRAPTFCYVVSEDARIDRRQLTLRDALERMVGVGMSTFLCCVSGWLVYFEGEEPGERCVRERTEPGR